MRRAVFWLTVILLAGTGLFYMKFRVQTMEAELAALNRALLAQQEAMHVFAAEWTYLNRPERLAKLNRRYLKLQPVTARQIADLEGIPPRAGKSAAVIGESQ